MKIKSDMPIVPIAMWGLVLLIVLSAYMWRKAIDNQYRWVGNFTDEGVLVVDGNNCYLYERDGYEKIMCKRKLK